MKKLVIKTVAITLSAIIGACLILFGALALFAPASIAGFFDKVGIYKSSIHFYERQYGKSDSIDDLTVLILKIDGERDSEREEKYIKILIERPDFEDYCQLKDDTTNDNVSTREFYYGEYAVALVRNGKFSSAHAIASEFVEEYGYTAYNPFSIMLAETDELLTNENLLAIKDEISRYLSGENANRVQADLDQIENLIQ